MSNIEFKPMGNNIYTLTKTVDGKTSTIKITDTNGNGLDNNDKFSVTGDISVFTSKELKDKFGEQNFYKGDNTKTDKTATNTVTKDGKIEIQAGQEYSLESLVKSLPEQKTPQAKTTDTSADILAIQEQYKTKLSMMQSQMQLLGTTTQSTMLLAMYGAPGAMASFQNTGVKFEQIMTSFVDILNPQGTTTKTPQAEAPTSAFVPATQATTPEVATKENSPAPAPAQKPVESKAPTATTGAPVATTETKTAPAPAATTTAPKVLSSLESKRAKIDKLTESYKNSPAAKAKQKEIADLEAKLKDPLQWGTYGRLKPSMQQQVDAYKVQLAEIESGKLAKEKEAQVLKTIEHVKGLVKNYKQALSVDPSAAANFKDAIGVYKDQLSKLRSEVSNYETDNSDDLIKAYREYYMTLSLNGLDK